MAGDSTEEHLSMRRLERACRYVNNYWMPVNSGLVARIQQDLDAGEYSNDLSRLLRDVRTDCGLFFHFVRRLVEMLEDESSTTPLNPIELFDRAGLEQLKTILGEAQELNISGHTLGAGSAMQLARYEEAIVSASTAETLAENCELDSESVFSAALLRQLGFALIAWNYPGAYEKAVSQLREDQSLDVVLSELLGFSPSLLAIRIMHQWGLDLNACSAIGLSADDQMMDYEQAFGTGSTLSRICSVGEALARAQHPEVYPSARGDWEAAREHIERELGAQGMQVVQERILENFDNYVTFCPEVFTPAVLTDPESFSAASSNDIERLVNPLLDRCEPAVQHSLTRLYQYINCPVDPSQTLRMLVREIIPSTEFAGGIFYTVDPTISRLVPHADIATVELRSLAPVDYSVVTAGQDMITVAYHSNELVIEYGHADDGSDLSAIAGVFGGWQRAGVLYLELPGIIPNDAGHASHTHFRALRYALLDCLNLRN